MVHEQDICDAISELHVISFWYAARQRIVGPHLLGVDSDGDTTLSAWQLSGGSGVGWRDFHTNKLSGLATTGQSFSGPRPGYNPNDQTLDRIICHL